MTILRSCPWRSNAFLKCCSTVIWAPMDWDCCKVRTIRWLKNPVGRNSNIHIRTEPSCYRLKHTPLAEKGSTWRLVKGKGCWKTFKDGRSHGTKYCFFSCNGNTKSNCCNTFNANSCSSGFPLVPCCWWGKLPSLEIFPCKEEWWPWMASKIRGRSSWKKIPFEMTMFVTETMQVITLMRKDGSNTTQSTDPLKDWMLPTLCRYCVALSTFSLLNIPS